MNRTRQRQIDHIAAALEDSDERELKAHRGQLAKVLILEEEALRKMRPHATKPNTAANYNKSMQAVAGLKRAIKALRRGDVARAQSELISLEGLSAPRRQEP